MVLLLVVYWSYDVVETPNLVFTATSLDPTLGAKPVPRPSPLHLAHFLPLHHPCHSSISNLHTRLIITS